MANGVRIPNHVDLVERFCADLRGRDTPLNSFRSRTFLAWLRLTYQQRTWAPFDASFILQEHVAAQGDPDKSLDFIVACQGYGPAARWRIMSSADVPDHARYAAKDIVERYEKQHIRKLYPAALSDPVMQEALNLATSDIQNALAMVESFAAELGSGGSASSN